MLRYEAAAFALRQRAALFGPPLRALEVHYISYRSVRNALALVLRRLLRPSGRAQRALEALSAGCFYGRMLRCEAAAFALRQRAALFGPPLHALEVLYIS